ncbi:hypothetical protein [Streptomyces sp. NPDC058272]|uniref:hypothetical protein n=1 Tax=Streptomyces sp. NPDC058272 TaxID=3346415 RepID=UPI0036EC1A49
MTRSITPAKRPRRLAVLAIGVTTAITLTACGTGGRLHNVSRQSLTPCHAADINSPAQLGPLADTRTRDILDVAVRDNTAITRVQKINRILDCSLETETEQLINALLHPTADKQADGI